MVRVFANVLQIIMLATCADALLAVESTLQLSSLGIGIDGTQEYGFVLVHAGICEQESRIIVGYG